MNKLINQYLKLRKQLIAMNFINYLISWDSETEAPVGCFELRSEQVSTLSEISYKLLMSKKSKKLIADLYENRDQLSLILRKEITDLYKTLRKKELVPKKEIIAYETLLSKASIIWTKAKLENNYELFKPTLQKIIEYNKRYVKYVETKDLKGYDVLLDEYEEGSNTKFYDEFFALLKQEIVPLVKKINTVKYKYNESFLKNKYDVTKQRKFAEYLMDVMNFDKTKGLMKESEHPFTSGFGTTDVRITNHYYEDLLTSSIFSVIHETGHGLYEQNCNPELDETLLGGGASMAMHESQSRFYENIIGRKYSFWETHYPVLQELFKDELKDTTLDDFYHNANKVECSLIRTEADELTYSLHIMIRYELEKGLISGTISVDELPQKWNEMYENYLGITPQNDSLGVLQDIHWAGGSFGYFPTYALGSAYAAQLYNTMKKEINIDEIIKSKNLKEINEWLKKHVHYYGKTLSPKEIIIKSTKEEFNPKYYIEYLKEKYMSIYNLN